MQLTLPRSDVVSAAQPYIVTLDRQDAPATATVQLALDLQRAEPSAPPCPVHWTTTVPPGPEPVAITIAVEGLAEGEYTGHLGVTAGAGQAACDLAFFRVPEPTVATFPFGVYAVWFTGEAARDEATLRELQGAGFNVLCIHACGLGPDARIFDRAARYGLQFRPSMRYTAPEPVTPPPGAERVLSDGTVLTGSWCLNRPDLQAVAAANVRRYVSEYVTHPGFEGAVYFGDDLFLSARFAGGQALLSCYCEYCRRDFRQRTGLEPPVTAEPPHAVVPAAHPWLQWMRYRCEVHYAGFIKAVVAAKDEAAPDVRLGLCHGWPDNPFSSVATGLYAPLTQPSGVVSSYCYPFLRSPAADFICHYEIGRMGHRTAPLWMLGVCAADYAAVPPWQVYQNYWNMLAAGYQSLFFFSWWDYGKIAADRPAAEQPRAQRSQAAVARCGAHKDWVLPAAQHWQLPPARCAALYSFTTEAFDAVPRNRGHLHSKEVCRLYRLALREHLPLQLICEEEVRAGILAQFDAVCLHDTRVLPDDVHARLQAFVAAGGTLLTDPDYLYTDGWHPEAKAFFKGALELAPESMIAVLRDRYPVPVEVSSPDVTVRRFTAGRVSYYVFVNNYADRYWGMTYSYGDPVLNYERADLVREAPVQATIRFATVGQYLYDALTGEFVGTSDTPLTLDLEPSWGRVLVALPVKCLELVVAGPAQAKCGDTVHFALRLVDEQGQLLPGAYTVRAVVQAPSGRCSRYSAYLGLADGVGELVLPLGVNDEVGPWQLAFAGGFPRRTQSVTLQVGRPGGQIAPDQNARVALHYRVLSSSR